MLKADDPDVHHKVVIELVFILFHDCIAVMIALLPLRQSLSLLKFARISAPNRLLLVTQCVCTCGLKCF